jgi:hypothetical protein
MRLRCSGYKLKLRLGMLGFVILRSDRPRGRQNDQQHHRNGDQECRRQAEPPHGKSVVFRMTADAAHVCLIVVLRNYFVCHCVRPA